MPVLSPLSQSKLPILSVLSQIKIASFILDVTDQNCQLFIVEDKKCQVYLKCHRSRLPALSILSQIKNVRFIFIVGDQNCQFYLYCHRSKLPALSKFELIFANSWPKSANCRPKLTFTNLKMPNLSFILPLSGQNVPIVGQK